MLVVFIALLWNAFFVPLSIWLVECFDVIIIIMMTYHLDPLTSFLQFLSLSPPHSLCSSTFLPFPLLLVLFSFHIHPFINYCIELWLYISMCVYNIPLCLCMDRWGGEGVGGLGWNNCSSCEELLQFHWG